MSRVGGGGEGEAPRKVMDAEGGGRAGPPGGGVRKGRSKIWTVAAVSKALVGNRQCGRFQKNPLY